MTRTSTQVAIWTEVAFFFLVSGAVFAQEPSSGNALLRCDPGSRIDGIDGDGRLALASFSSTFNDCTISLSPGTHVVKACYDVSLPGFSARAGSYPHICPQGKELTFDAVPGGVYRLRLALQHDWQAWIEDVTATEADVPASPSANKSRQSLPSDQKKSMVLVRVLSPRDEPVFLKGKVEHLWFKLRDLSLALGNPSKMKREKDGFFTDRFSNGDTIALHYMFHQEGSAFSRQFEYACQTELPVYEDLPGGKVLYLGDYRFEVTILGGTQFAVTQDVEAARRFLETNYPKLAGNLVVAEHRILRSTEICGMQPGRLRMKGS